jgi:hypothetical protein
MCVDCLDCSNDLELGTVHQYGHAQEAQGVRGRGRGPAATAEPAVFTEALEDAWRDMKQSL